MTWSLEDAVASLPWGSAVAIDGVDCAGKTTLADTVAGVGVVRASVDDHLRPVAERYARGRASAEGCYRDSHDLEAVRRLVVAFRDGSPQAVLVVDGVFLLRPELTDLWDLAVHLVLPDEEVVRRAAVRDPGTDPRLYLTRYLPAQRLYEAEARPRERADVVLDARDMSVASVRTPDAGGRDGRGRGAR